MDMLYVLVHVIDVVALQCCCDHLYTQVQHDRQKNPTVFVRVYSGKLKARAALFNSSKTAKERPTRIMQVLRLVICYTAS
jgi:hypothetical protein